MKKVFFSFLLLIITITIVSGCAFQNRNKTVNSNESKLKVAATIFPLYDIVREIGGNFVEVNLILSPGSSPHTYEVSPADIKKLQNTKVFFTIGGEVDHWIENIITSISNAEVFNLNQFVTLKPFQIQLTKIAENEKHEEKDHEHDHEHETESMDPHYWLDPNNGKIMAQKIADKLSALDPKHADYYQINSQNFINKLIIKDQEWQTKIDNLNNKNLVVFHDAWGYFSDHFNLNLVASFEPFPGKTPSPQYLIALQEQVKMNNITSLFIEPQLSQEAIKTLANDLGVTINILDPLGGIENRNSYIELIDFNVTSIINTLK